MAPFVKSLLDGPSDTVDCAYFVLQQLFRDAFGHVEACGVARVVCRTLLKGIARRIDSGASGVEFEVDGIALPQRPSKRMRVDEDYRKFVVVDSIRAHRARSGAQLLRAIGGVASTSGSKWEQGELLVYQQAGKRTFQRCSILAVSSDAARLGDLAEETLVFSAWSPEANRGFVGPCQVQGWVGVCRIDSA